MAAAQQLYCSTAVGPLLQIDALQHTLTAEQPGWLGFCHNDLQYGNMLLAAHTSTPPPESLLPGEDNVTQGVGREEALTGLGDRTLGSSADLNPLLANLLSEKLEGMSPRKAGNRTGAFWDGHPSFSKAQSLKGEDVSASDADQDTDGVSAQLEDMDPAQLLTHDADEADDSGAEPDKLPSQLPTQLHVSTKTADPPADAHIRLIDYEYAGVNPVALDLANHWCEYAADYHTDTPHVLDYTRFPDHEHQAGFIHAYIETVISMSKKHGDKLSWDGGEISYSAPAPGAMHIHTDTDCNQSLYSKDAISASLQNGSKMRQGLMADASSSAPAAQEGQLQVHLPNVLGFHLLCPWCKFSAMPSLRCLDYHSNYTPGFWPRALCVECLRLLCFEPKQRLISSAIFPLVHDTQGTQTLLTFYTYFTTLCVPYLVQYTDP